MYAMHIWNIDSMTCLLIVLVVLIASSQSLARSLCQREKWRWPRTSVIDTYAQSQGRSRFDRFDFDMVRCFAFDIA